MNSNHAWFFFFLICLLAAHQAELTVMEYLSEWQQSIIIVIIISSFRLDYQIDLDERSHLVRLTEWSAHLEKQTFPFATFRTGIG